MKQMVRCAVMMMLLLFIAAAASAQTHVLLNEDFDDGLFPLAFVEKNNSVGLKTQSNTVLSMQHSANTDFYVEYALTKADTDLYFLHSKLKIQQGSMMGGSLFYVRDNSSGVNKNVPLLILSGGIFYSCGRTALFEAPTGSWADVWIRLDLNTDTYSVTVNGNCIKTDIALTEKLTALTLVRHYINAEGSGTMFVDDFGVYKGAGQTPIYENDFENASTGLLTVIKKGNQVTTVPMANGYLEIEKTGADDCYAELNCCVTEGRYVTLEFSVCLFESGITGNLLMLRDAVTDNVVSSFPLSISGNKIYAMGNEIATLEYGKWKKIAISVDTQGQKLDAFADGERIYSGIGIGKKLSNITAERFYLNGGTGKIGIDNFKIYEAAAPLYIDSIETQTPSVFKSDLYATVPLGQMCAIETNADTIYIGGEKTHLSNPSILQNDKIYIPTYDAQRLFADAGNDVVVNGIGYTDIALSGMNIVDNKKGLIILSENEINLSNATTENIHKYMFFERYNALSLCENAGTSRPRILASGVDFERMKNEMITNENILRRCNTIIARADSVLDSETVEYTIASGKLFDVAVEFKNKINALAFAYKITSDVKYAVRAAQELESVINFPDWNEANHFLDTSEMAFGVVLACDWLHDELSPELLERAESKVRLCLLENARKAYNLDKGAFWTSTDINWNAVCNGAVAICAMNFWENDKTYYSELLKNALRGYENCLYRFAPDGAWNEGPHYWSYCMEYSAYLMSTLEAFFGNDLGLGKMQGFDKTAYFQMMLDSPQGMNDYHDGFLSHVNSGVLFYLGRKYNDKTVTAAKLYFDRCYASAPQPCDVLWYDGSVTDDYIDISPDAYFRETETVSMRQKWQDEDGSFVSFHGGNNNGDHYHSDAGAFVFDNLGERWALDIGIENYNTTGTSADFRRSLQGHNTVEIIEEGKAVGAQNKTGDAIVTKFESGVGSAISVLDMTPLYDCAEDYKRGFFLRNNRTVLEIRDEIMLSAPSEIVWRMNTDAQVTLSGNAAQLSKNGKTVYLQFECDCEAFMTLDSSLPLSSYRNTGIKQLVIRIPGQTFAKLSVVISPQPCETRAASNIDNWSINEPDINFFSDGKRSYKIGEGSVAVKSNSQNTLTAASYKNNALRDVKMLESGEECFFEKPFDEIRVFDFQTTSLKPQSKSAKIN